MDDLGTLPPFFSPDNSEPSQLPSIDWQAALEDLLMTGAGAAGEIEKTYSIPITFLAGGVVELSAKGNVDVYDCKGTDGAIHTQLDFNAKATIFGGIGAGYDLSKYKLPGSAGNTYNDQITRLKRLKKHKPKIEPKKPELESAKTSLTKRYVQEKEECPPCETGWTGSLSIGIKGEAYLGGGGEIKGGPEWKFGTPFDWEHIKLKIEGNVGFKAAITAKIGIEGEAKFTWKKIVD